MLIHNPSTPTSDQDRISLYNVTTTSSRRVMRIKKNINYGVSGWSNSKFPKLTYKICMADSKENLWWDLGIERVKVTLFLSFNRVTLFFFSFSSTSELNVNHVSVTISFSIIKCRVTSRWPQLNHVSSGLVWSFVPLFGHSFLWLHCFHWNLSGWWADYWCLVDNTDI